MRYGNEKEIIFLMINLKTQNKTKQTSIYFERMCRNKVVCTFKKIVLMPKELGFAAFHGIIKRG